MTDTMAPPAARPECSRGASPRATDRTRAPRVRATASAPAHAGRTGGTAPFVLLIMVLLASGLVATLWLSTAAAADSYRLEGARTGARDLSEQAEHLRRDVEAMQSAPSVAAGAARIGMVPGGTPSVLLVRPDGSTQLVGAPTPASAAPPGPATTVVSRPAPASPTPTSPATPAAGTTGAVTAVAGDPEGPR